MMHGARAAPVGGPRPEGAPAGMMAGDPTVQAGVGARMPGMRPPFPGKPGAMEQHR